MSNKKLLRFNPILNDVNTSWLTDSICLMQKMKTGMAFTDEFISGEKDKNFVKNQSFKNFTSSRKWRNWKLIFNVLIVGFF